MVVFPYGVEILLDVRFSFLWIQIVPLCKDLCGVLACAFLAEHKLSLDLVALLIPCLFSVLVKHDLQVAFILIFVLCCVTVSHQEQVVVVGRAVLH